MAESLGHRVDADQPLRKPPHLLDHAGKVGIVRRNPDELFGILKRGGHIACRLAETDECGQNLAAIWMPLCTFLQDCERRLAAAGRVQGDSINMGKSRLILIEFGAS